MLKCLVFVLCALSLTTLVFCAPGSENSREYQSTRQDVTDQLNVPSRSKRQSLGTVEVVYLDAASLDPTKLKDFRRQESPRVAPVNGVTNPGQNFQQPSDSNLELVSQNSNFAVYKLKTGDAPLNGLPGGEKTEASDNQYYRDGNKQYSPYSGGRNPPPPPPEDGRPPPPPPPHHYPPPPHHHHPPPPPPPDDYRSNYYDRSRYYDRPPPPPPRFDDNRRDYDDRQTRQSYGRPPPPPHRRGPPPPDYGRPPPHRGGPPDRFDRGPSRHYGGPPDRYDDRPPHHHGGPPDRYDDRPPPHHHGGPPDRRPPPPPYHDHRPPPDQEPYDQGDKNNEKPQQDDDSGKVVDGTKTSSTTEAATDDDEQYELDVRFSTDEHKTPETMKRAAPSGRVLPRLLSPSPFIFQASAVKPEDD